MNLTEMHDRVDFWADTVKSPRYSKAQRDASINIAIDSFVKDRYDNIKISDRNRVAYSFEIVERVKEELYTITEIDYQSLVINNETPTPPNFLYHIVSFVEVNGKKVLCIPKAYVENDLSENSFARPGLDQPIFRRTAKGFKYDAGYGSINKAFISYMKIPALVKWNETAIGAGPNVLQVGKSYYVVSGVAIEGSIVHIADTVFISQGTGFVGTGIVNMITNSDLPVHTHEEICKISASVLTGTFEDYNKSQKIDLESKRS
jgi:hypothetical protein